MRKLALVKVRACKYHERMSVLGRAGRGVGFLACITLLCGAMVWAAPSKGSSNRNKPPSRPDSFQNSLYKITNGVRSGKLTDLQALVLLGGLNIDQNNALLRRLETQEKTLAKGISSLKSQLQYIQGQLNAVGTQLRTDAEASSKAKVRTQRKKPKARAAKRKTKRRAISKKRRNTRTVKKRSPKARRVKSSSKRKAKKRNLKKRRKSSKRSNRRRNKKPRKK